MSSGTAENSLAAWPHGAKLAGGVAEWHDVPADFHQPQGTSEERNILMSDPCVEELAGLLCEYSLKLRKGDVVLIRGPV